MNLGKGFYIKYLIVLIPCFIICLPAFFMPKHKRDDYFFKNKLLNKMSEWCFKC